MGLSSYLLPFPFIQAKFLSVEFKSLDAAERSKWDVLAEKDKKRYEKEMSSYVVPEEYEDDGGGKKKKSKKEKDPNKPKRNQSAFFIYSNAVRSEVKARYPEAKFGDIAKVRLLRYILNILFETLFCLLNCFVFS